MIYHSLLNGMTIIVTPLIISMSAKNKKVRIVTGGGGTIKGMSPISLAHSIFVEYNII